MQREKDSIQHFKTGNFQNFFLFVGYFWPHGSASGSKNLVTSSLVIRRSTHFYSQEHLQQFTCKIAVLDEPCKTQPKDYKITFEIFFKVFTFHKSPLGTKSVQNLHDDAVQGLVRNCLCLLCTEYTVKCTVYLLCTCGCGQATEYI